VGPKLGSLFARHGIKTILDLVEFFPRTYEFHKSLAQISEIQTHEIVQVAAQILAVRSFTLPGVGHKKIHEVIVGDSSGRISCKFFKAPYKGYFERLQQGQRVIVKGKVGEYKGRKEFFHPELKEVSPPTDSSGSRSSYGSEDDMGDEGSSLSNEVLPIYTEIEGLSSVKIHRLIQLALGEMMKNKEEWVDKSLDKLPVALRNQYKLMSRREALFKIHHPQQEDLKEILEFKTMYQRRIIFDEFFWLEFYLATQKVGFQKDLTHPLRSKGEKVSTFLKTLPFQLTKAQQKVFAEIKTDLEKEHPMHRLVQGDVGCGKTMVAFLATILAAESGFQSTLMVPTEILAEQHFKNAQKFLAPAGLRLALLTGKTKNSERVALLKKLQEGEIDLCIGTHALLEPEVQFKKLGLVIIDEQHRFGVQQRGVLKEKGWNPHFLIMTATPIPRTLAMTVYGDLDVSVIDELPPGRSPIQTRVIYESLRVQALDFLKDQVAKGRQAYIIYPLVEESEKIDLKNATSEFEKLKIDYPMMKFGLIHGKMKSAEKDSVMDQFRQNEIQVLVSTTVIEVGVDVPNANLMIIEHAERFGLSQLHQLRGRVGRGAHKSFCVLINGKAVSAVAKERTQVMEQTSDGFKIAEFDLEFRGPGEFLGTRQSGLPGFKMAHLVRDILILQEARQAAFDLLKKDPKLEALDHQELRKELLSAHGPAVLARIG
jgi:ATP-dependent DNA helicase RecG